MKWNDFAFIVLGLLGIFIGGFAFRGIVDTPHQKMVEYVVIVDDNQYDVVTANEFIVDDTGSLIFKRDGSNESAYACGYWTRVFDKRKANIEKEEVSAEPITLEVITEKEETNVDTGASP